MKHIISIIFLFLIIGVNSSHAQTYIMSNGGNVSTCGGTFYDSGGGLGNYGDNLNLTYTICPNNGTSSTVNFTSFNIENNYDFLTIYDGANISAPVIGVYTGGVGPGLVTATPSNASGCLTFVFTSDTGVNSTGWIGTIGCVLHCQDIIANPTFSPAPDPDGIIRICKGASITMSATGTYPENNSFYAQSDATSTFIWKPQDGVTNYGQTVTHTYNNEGGYIIQLDLKDIKGCYNSNGINQEVHVSTTPNFSASIAIPDTICLGDPSSITGDVDPVTFDKSCNQPVFPPVALPDGSGVAYSTSVNLECFSIGQKLNNINNLLSICVNMEHSYMGDVNIDIICPNGQMVTLHDYSGGFGTYLGIPVDNDALPNAQGTGFDYCWTPTATNGTWTSNSVSNTTLPAGSYESDEPLNGLVGCNLNGIWTLVIKDELYSDNGFVFDWSLNFNPAIIPPAVIFTPTIVSEGWQPDPTILGGTNPINVLPTALGNSCYTYEVTDNLGCDYDTTICITVNPNTVVNSIPNVDQCTPYTLPVITGANLSGNEAYFTGMGRTGTQYNAGDVISTTQTLYINDSGSSPSFCGDESIGIVITIFSSSITMSCPPSLTANCAISEQPPYANFTAFQNAGGSATTNFTAAILPNSFILLSEVSDGNSCPETVTRTYQITDDCGSTQTCTQIIEIDDKVNPTGTAPALAIQCVGALPLPNIAIITDEADNCTTTPIVTYIGESSDGGTCPEIITRTYRITDGCGNSTDVLQTITVFDDTNPTGTAPANVTVQCIGEVPAADITLITDEADNCTVNPTVTHVGDISDGNTCPEVITRTYRMTDDCGNNTDITQTITINDNTNPTGTAPLAATLQCVGDVPAADITLITDEADNCTVNPIVTHEGDVSNGNTCPEVITRTYRITDACGNFTDLTQVFTINDVISPTGTAPAATTVQCIGDVPAVDVNSITDEADNCTVNPTVSHVGDVSNGSTCPEIITRTYRISDDCGNNTDVTQIITVNDDILPTGTAPANITVQCIGDVPVADINSITNEADNCTTNPTVTHFGDVSNGNTCAEIITRTYNIADDCGNNIDVIQTITINDNILPTGTAPANITVQCIGNVPAANIALITDEADNCTVNPIVTHVGDVSNNNTCPEIITRTYNIADDCGNNINVTQTITVFDDTNPTGTAPANVTVQCIGEVPAADITLITDEADNCTVNPTVTHVGDISDGNTCPEVITRTYRMTDDCGNNTDITQTITINDNTNPTGTAPLAATLQCVGDVPAADITLITDEADNCTVNPIVTHEGDVSNGNTCPEVITRTYRITDACGNFTDLTQVFTINDVISPTGTAPAATTVQCIGDVPAVDVNSITDEADNCTVNPTVSHVGDVSNGSTCPEIITRTYRISDDCGNNTDVTQIITVNDDILPTGTAPANITVQCIGDVPVADINSITNEADNCTTNPTVTHLGDVSNGNTCAEIITRTYNIADDCGNNIDVIQTITINDNILPTGTAPANITVQCIGNVPAANIALITDEADNCTVNPIVTHVGDVSNNNTCPEIITRTYNIADDCGNNINVTQTITVFDDINPTGTAPANVTVQCIGDVPAVDIALITDEADNCTVNPTVTHVGDISDGNTCPEVITRTYRITDDCGNNTDITQTITINDDILPTGSAPADLALQCFADIPAVDINSITDEADNCTVNPIITHVGDVSNGNSCPQVVTRTYNIADACGNNINVSRVFTINDDTNPTANNPAAITVQCLTDVPAVNIAEVVGETDNCTVNPTVAFVSESTDANTCNGEIITRIYSVTDDCGNSINVSQSIIIDSYTPTFTVSGMGTGSCGGNDGTITLSGLDPNTNYEMSYDGGGTNAITTNSAGEYVITGLSVGSFTNFTVSDGDCPACTTTENVSININDPTSGFIDAGLDQEYCEGTTVILTANNPSGAILSWDNGVTDGVGFVPPVGITFYTVTADLTNCFSSDQMMITVSPAITDITCPAGLTATCDISEQPAYADFDEFIAAGGSATIPAGGVIDSASFVLFSEVSNGSTCPKTITRTYQIADTCGVTVSCTQEIIINDLINPTGTAPADVLVQCIGDVPAVDITSITDEADNCTANPIVTHVSDISNGNTCPEIITRTYNIADACGNNINVTQIITVNDDILPTGTAPVDLAFQCIGDIPAEDVTLITDEADNCTVNPTVTHVGDVSNGNSCPEVVTRTYNIADACGNNINVTQLFTINDDTNPTGTAPADLAFQCVGDIPVVDTTSITDEADNCTVNPTVTHVSDVSDGNTCPEVITRTYNIADDCGNNINVAQVFTINDDILPTGTAPADVLVQCIGDVPVVNINSITDEADNCTVNPTVTHVGDVSDGNTCPEVITRTYNIADDCGNNINVIQTITINDDILPTGTAPADLAVQCIGDVPAVDVNAITNEADNCTVNPIVTHVSDVSDGNTCPEIITRTYNIADDCGNNIDVIQVITIDDDTNPTGTAPAAVLVQCIGDVPAADITLITDEADNCTTNPTVTYVGDVSNGNTCPEIITRTYNIADDCGNNINVTQIITINDDILPTGTAPADLAFQCIGDIPAADVTLITDEADNCTVIPTVTHVGDVSDGNTCPEVITRTYNIADACGNSINVNQLFTINDDILPTGTAPADLAFQCVGDIPAADITVIIDEADNCTVNPIVTHVSDVSDGNTCPEVITRTYNIADACGNNIDVTQIFTVNDDIDPTGTAAPLAVQCIGDVPAPDINYITDEADNCAVNPTVTHVGDVSDGNTCPEVITRTYNIADDCGNDIDITQIITINDDIDPTGNAPADVIVQCIGDVPVVDITSITNEADNCTVNPIVTHVSDVSDGNTCSEVITRTYNIADDCGNNIDVIQIITINDDTAPTGTAPAAVAVQCIGDVPAADIALITDEADNCTVTPTVAHTGDVSDGNTCPEVITRTYTITDDCGNNTDLTQTITINDDILPTGTAPADLAVQCLGDIPVVDITSITDEADNCTVNPTVTHTSDISDGNTCPEVITRTYNIADDCGNNIDVIQTFTINDDILPTGTAPADAAVQCIGDVPVVDITAITDEADNCTVNPTVTHVSDVSDGNTCPEVITRTYNIADDCGNNIDVVQTITINDDILPTASNPTDLTVECLNDVPATDIALVTDEADNCTVNPTVAFVSESSDGNACDGEIVTRIYSVTDDCGNSIDVTHTITIDSYTPPAFTVSSTNPTACAAANGTITLSGLNPSSNYEMSYDGGASYPITTNSAGEYIITGLIASSYVNFTVYDEDCPSCSTTEIISINLSDPNAPAINAGLDQEHCEGTTVTLNADNPESANISWDNGVTDGVGFIPPVGTTYYTVTAELANCFSSDVLAVLIHPLPAVLAGSDIDACIGDPIILNGSGATSYTWDNGVTDGVSFIQSVGTKTYTVTGTSIYGCDNTDQVDVTVHSLPLADFVADTLTGCYPLEVNFSSLLHAPTDVCTFTINGTTVLPGTNVNYTFNSVECYDINLEVVSQYGCINNLTENDYICVGEYPIADFSVNPDELSSFKNEASFTNESIGSETYEWSFGDGESSTLTDPNHLYSGEEDGVDSYTIQMIAYSEYGCADTVYKILPYVADLIYYIPNTFTPDGDKYNETFKPVFHTGYDPMNYRLRIYNRWGELLFESNDANYGWDGSYGVNGAKRVQDGVYIWKIEFREATNNNKVELSGNVNIIK